MLVIMKRVWKLKEVDEVEQQGDVEMRIGPLRVLDTPPGLLRRDTDSLVYLVYL